MAVTEEEVVMEEGGAVAPAPAEEQAPEELQARAAEIQARTQSLLDARAARFEEITQGQAETAEGRPLAAAAGAPMTEAGTPITYYGYSYWDCLMFGPYQFPPVSSPPYTPSKVLRAGEWSLLQAAVWINPNWHFGNLPATQILGGRAYRASFELFNFSRVANGPDLRRSGTFGSPASSWTWFNFFFRLPNPGAYPNLYEAVFTIDIADSGLDLASFATWHYDPDFELPWGPYAPRWRHDMPARFMAYRF